MNFAENEVPAQPNTPAATLSYKFQRLREQIRLAVASGEFAGKLPGERVLAKRFGVNAKTLSKALTDLAAEGLLQRSVGLGTFVKGSLPAALSPEHCLILADDAGSPLVQQLSRRFSQSRLVTDTSLIRPSFLAQFAAVINCMNCLPEPLFRDLVVRGLPVITTRPQAGYATHAVLMDKTQALFTLARDMILAGHRRIVAMDLPGQTIAYDALRAAAARYSPQMDVSSAHPNDWRTITPPQVSAILCGDASLAAQLLTVGSEQYTTETRPALAAVGDLADPVPCTGYYLDPARQAQAIDDLLHELSAQKPTTLWISGRFIDTGSMNPPILSLGQALEGSFSLLAS